MTAQTIVTPLLIVLGLVVALGAVCFAIACIIALKDQRHALRNR